MKTIHMTMIALIFSFGAATNAAKAQNQDWPNLKEFQEDNKKVGLPEEGENRVVFMGNSITIGWSQSRPDFFKGKPYVNRGISGQTTPQMLLRFRQDVIELQPKIVVILAGINDIAGNTGPATLKMISDNIQSMAELAHANGIRVVLSSTLPAYDFPWSPGMEPARKVKELNRMIETYAMEKGHIFLDYYKAMVDDRGGLPKKYASDEVHPTVEGYKVMEPLVEAAIAKALEE